MSRPIERRSELLQVSLVCVALRRVGPGVPHERLECYEVASALAKEAVGETVSKLVGGKGANTGSSTHPRDHTAEGLRARRLLRILPPPLAPILRHPQLNLDHENMIVKFRSERAEEDSELQQNIGVDWHPLPMAALPKDVNPSTDQIDVTPPASKNLGVP